MEDALKKLDKLTNEEARMAVAQNLKATHNVEERVRGVANAVVDVDNRVAGVNMVVEQTANDVDQIKRSSSLDLYKCWLLDLTHSVQGNNYERIFTNGSPHRTHQRTITSHAVLITRKLQIGFSRAECSKNGSQ